MENNEINEPIITVTAAKVHDAYNVAGDNEDLQKVLIALFGLEACTGMEEEDEEEEDNRPVTERIKTFSDAYDELSPMDPLIEEFDKVGLLYEGDNTHRNLLAFLKLRIITAALNEGWNYPPVDSDDDVYYPWFMLYSQEEWNMLSEETKKGGLLLGGYANGGSAAGFASAYSNDVPSYSGTYIGSRLCFKSEELATYAARQFASLYADYYLG